MCSSGISVASTNSIRRSSQASIKKTTPRTCKAYPDKIEAMLDRVFEEIDIKFSVKCRLGYFSPEEINAIIPIFNKFPFSELIIHPRIGKQLYKGEANVERFKELMPQINAPVVYNGDIISVESFERIHKTLNGGPSISSGTCKTIVQFMLGRGLLANPFLAEDIKSSVIARRDDKAIQGNDSLDYFVPRNDVPDDKINRLHNYVIDLYDDRLRHAGGSPKVLGRMKELWSYLMYSFDEPQDIWRKIKKINALKDYEEAVETVFRSHTLRIIT